MPDPGQTLLSQNVEFLHENIGTYLNLNREAKGRFVLVFWNFTKNNKIINEKLIFLKDNREIFNILK